MAGNTSALVCSQCQKDFTADNSTDIPSTSVYSYMKTITHLQNVWKREKQKNLSVGNEMRKLTNKSKEINEALGEVLLSCRGKSPD